MRGGKGKGGRGASGEGRGGKKDVKVYEYSAPTRFEDEEIDEETAFTAEDYAIYGDVGRKRPREESDDEVDAAAFGDLIDFGGSDEEEDDDESSDGEMDLDDGESEEDEGEVDESAHKKFLQQISSGLSSKPPRKRHKPERSEHAEESEFALDGGETVGMEDLLGSLGDSSAYGDLKKQMEKLQERQAPLQKPLSAPVKGRLSRRVAYEKVSKDVTKWQHTVAMNRRAETISFLEPAIPTVTNKSLAAKFKPQTEMEMKVAAVLRDSGIEEKKISQYEELALNELDENEVRERQGQLAKMRSLMFYNEKRMKHKKKIKSRKYRKILKRAKQKHELTLEELASVDPEKYKEELEKREMERMRERLTLKHSAKSGQWARRTAKMKDAHSKQAVAESIARGAELKKKMRNLHGSDSDSDFSDSSDESGSEEERDGEDGFMAFGKEEEEEEEEATGIHALKFMQRAKDKQKQEYEESLRDEERDSDGEAEVTGRLQFGNMDGEDTNGQGEQRAPPTRKGKGRGGLSKGSKEDMKAVRAPAATADAAANPWVGGVAKKGKKARGKADEELDVSDIIQVKEATMGGGNSDLLSSQKSVVAEAFAGMDVVKEFAKAKRAAMEEDEPEEVEEKVVPGWGSWAGDGAPKTFKKKKSQAEVAKEKAERLKRRAKRADDGLDHVIISERKDKKSLKYTVPSLPYPYTSKEQYELSMRQPLGPEWNTKSSHSKMTQPRVLAKSGTVINPISRQIHKKGKARQRKARVPKNLM